jgi:hypothetical protein
MNEIIYWTVGALWIVLCFALGFYIRSKNMQRNKVKIGFLAIFISYLFGIGILVAALNM